GVHDGRRLLAVGDLEVDARHGLLDRSRHDGTGDPEALRAVGPPRRDGFGHGAEVDDVLAEHDGEHDDRGHRDAAQAERDDRPPLRSVQRSDLSARRVRQTIESQYAASTTAVSTNPAMTYPASVILATPRSRARADGLPRRCTADPVGDRGVELARLAILVE